MLHALPKGDRRDKPNERALAPRTDGTATWKFPVTFKMTSPLGFWKRRIAPRLERKVERETCCRHRFRNPMGREKQERKK